MEIFTIESTKSKQLLDITSTVKSIAGKKNFAEGAIFVYTPHTTAGITINENADPDVSRDVIDFLGKLIPANYPFKHMEGNSDAHIMSSIIGCSEIVPLNNSKLQLGTWQGIYFCEFDGPRARKVYINFLQPL